MLKFTYLRILPRLKTIILCITTSFESLLIFEFIEIKNYHQF